MLLATENMLLLPLLVIAVDEVAFAMNQEVESAGGSDTMKRKKRNTRERVEERLCISSCIFKVNTIIFIDVERRLREYSKARKD